MTDLDTKSLDSSEPGLRDNAELYGQAGLATYVAAKIFGNPSSFPRGTPDWLQASVESQANFAQRLPGTAEMTIGGANGGPLDMRTKEELEHDADADAVESMRTVAERIDHQREIERQEWAQQVHSFAGVRMTGAEWHDLGAELKQEGELREWLVSRFMKSGKSRKDAERKADDVADVVDIMAKPESERTDEERTKLERAEKDPEIRKVLPELAEAKKKLEAGQTIEAEDRVAPSTMTADAQMFASAPALADHHSAAMAATAPLDARPASSIPQQTASIPLGGLDI